MTIQTSSRVRIGMLSLGCVKTLVDSETILGKLSGADYALADSITDCDVALLNTCGFIHEAQKESVDRILDLIQLKKQKKIRAVVVMGCLVQRFPKELEAELKEVDAFVGSGEYDKISDVVTKVLEGEKSVSIGQAGYLATSIEPRIALTPRHFRYIKISEGCDHICTFCSIPSFRGKHRSRTISDVVTEANQLVDQGAKEIILTGQDTTYFGRDLQGRWLLPELLKQLEKVKGIDWIRILYAYPSCIETSLMEVMRDSAKVCHYLDMPLQHASDPMLTAMKRGITQRRTLDLIRKFRDYVPDLAIRTTFIVGFPGETDKDYQDLLGFMKEIQFERLGIFTYSKEEGTPAAAMPNQVPDKIKRERYDQAMLLQQEISQKNNRKLLGRTFKTLIEERDEANPNIWIGRTYMDAPEVDANVFVLSKSKLNIGSFYPIKITSTQEYDLVGQVEAIIV